MNNLDLEIWNLHSSTNKILQFQKYRAKIIPHQS